MDWEELFRELLDAVEQVPHPMAEEIWSQYNEAISDEGDE